MNYRRILAISAALAGGSLFAQSTPPAPGDDTPAAAPIVPATEPGDTPATPPAGQSDAAAAPVEVSNAAPTEPDVRVVTEAPPPPKVSKASETLSVDFPDADVRTVLRNVADLFELNVVIPDTLQGSTSIKLRDVTWRQVFQVVLEPLGYTYVEDGNIIKIVSLQSLAQEPVATEVFVLNYARASEIVPAISGLIDTSAGGKILVDGRTNSLVITERPSHMNRVRPIIEKLDRATDQVMIETKFIEVTNADVKNLGVNWQGLNGLTVGASNLSNEYTRDNQRTTQNGASNTGTTTTNNALTNGNTTSNTVTNTNGGVTTTSTTTSTGGINGSTTVNNVVQSVNSLLDANTGGHTLTAVFSASDFNVVLSALTTLSSTRIVSDPTVVTLNNTESTIDVGEEYPIPQYRYNDQQGLFEISGFEYKPIGILMKVTPQVNAAGFIKLSVEPEVSQRNGETSFGGASGASIPIIATRKAKTQVSLRDGYTMGIGGLLRTQSTKGGTKVPVLGDIPGIGRLFRSDKKESDVTNLLIFVTAKTLNAQGAPVEQIFDPRQVRQMDLGVEDLPGYREPFSPLRPLIPPPRPRPATATPSATPAAKPKTAEPAAPAQPATPAPQS